MNGELEEMMQEVMACFNLSNYNTLITGILSQFFTFTQKNLCCIRSLAHPQ